MVISMATSTVMGRGSWRACHPGLPWWWPVAGGVGRLGRHGDLSHWLAPMETQSRSTLRGLGPPFGSRSVKAKAATKTWGHRGAAPTPAMGIMWNCCYIIATEGPQQGRASAMLSNLNQGGWGPRDSALRHNEGLVIFYMGIKMWLIFFNEYPKAGWLQESVASMWIPEEPQTWRLGAWGNHLIRQTCHS